MHKNTPNSADGRKPSGRMGRAVMAGACLLIVAGLILMCGPGTTEAEFVTDIFSVLRIRIAPALCLAGYVMAGVGIILRK